MEERESKYSWRKLHDQLRAFHTNYLLVLLFSVMLFWLLCALLSRTTLPGDERVTVLVEAEVLNDDIFNLYFLPGQETEYHESRTLEANVSGKKSPQLITFYLPDSLSIKNLRIDLGRLPVHHKIMIRNIELQYNGHHLLLFSPAKNTNFFSCNEYVNLNNEKEFFLKPLKDGSYDPFLLSRPLSQEYQQLLHKNRKFPYPILIAFIFSASLLIYALFFLKTLSANSVFYSMASCFFILLLLLPTFGGVFEWDDKNSAEKRALAEKPEFKISEMANFPKKFEAYFNDHFAFREILVNLGSKIRYHVFGSSSVAKAAVGKDGWIFLNGLFYYVTADLQKTNLFTGAQLEKSAALWENRRLELDSLGIKYYMAFWPDKHIIYPEFMPFCMRVLNKDTITKPDQALSFLRAKNSSLRILDVRPRLLAEKTKILLYERYDSHWNEYGAYLAYAELMTMLGKDFPALKAKELDQYNLNWGPQPAGDLSQMLGLALTEEKPTFILKADSSIIESPTPEGFPKRSIIFENKKAVGGLSILIYRDSFTNALIPFLKPHFAKIVLIWDTDYSLDLVKQVKPNIVLECYASRYFR